MSWVFGPGGGGTPGGANGDIQFNSSGSFSGSPLLTTDGAGNLSASANISASAFYGDGSNLTGVTASAVQVADGPQYSLQFRFDSPVSGDLSGSSDLLWDPATSDVIISGSVRLEDGKEFYGDLEGAILFPAKVDEVGGIGKGKVVYIKGLSGTTPTIGLAACDDPAKMPAFGLCAFSASNNTNTQVATFGSLDGLNLNNISPGHSFSEGDILYVNTGSGGTAGTFTNIKPTGSNNLLQNIGKVVRNGVSSNGQIKVGGAGRANDTPNLDKGHIFVGNETDQAIQDNTIFISASANRVGINNTSPDHTLTVGGDISASANVSASAFYFGPGGRQIIEDTGTDMSILASTTGMFISADGGNLTLQNNVAIDTAGVISSSQNISGSGLYAVDAYVSSIPADRVLVSTTNGQITSHSPFTFSSDILSVPTITASVGIEVTSSANGSINIGQGIRYTFGGKDLLDVFEGEFKLRSTDYHQAISQVQTSNFNIEGFQTFVVDCTGSVVTGTLPGITTDDQIGLTYTVKDLFGSGSANNVVVKPSGSQKIDGGTAAKIQTNYGALTITAFSSSARGYGWGIVSTT